jgi:hypothetical protein
MSSINTTSTTTNPIINDSDDLLSVLIPKNLKSLSKEECEAFVRLIYIHK